MKNITEVNESSFQAEVLEASLPVLVDFWAPWCGPCRMVTPVLERLSEKLDGKVKFVKLNTDENAALAQRHRIMAIPSLIVFQAGKEVERVVGFQSEKQLESILKKFVASTVGSIS